MSIPVDPIDLLCGWPNPALLPAPDLLRSATNVLTVPSIAHPALLYAPDEGWDPLRVQVAQWLTTFYQPCAPISPQRICITGGASQNLACVLQVFTDPLYTRNVWMVDPTYHLAGRVIDDSGFAARVRAVPEDDEGINLDFLEAGLRAAEAKATAENNTEPVGIFNSPRNPKAGQLELALPDGTFERIQFQCGLTNGLFYRKLNRLEPGARSTNTLSMASPLLLILLGRSCR